MIPELDAVPQVTSLKIRFGLHPVLNEFKTNGGNITKIDATGKQVTEFVPGAGRPIFDDVEYIEIRVPGERDVIHRPVRESDRQEYAAQYARWKANAASGGEVGTLLSEVPFLSKSQVLELEHFGCRTVEQLAGMPDSALKNVGPILDLRAKAQNYLKAAKSSAPLATLEAALKAKDDEMEVMKQQIAALMAQSKAAAEKQTVKPSK